MNLNYKLFWDANAARKKTSFFLRKTVYHFVEKTWKARYEFPIFLQIGIEVIKRILLCGIVAFLLFIADSWVISHFEIKINDSAFFNFLLSGLSVTGIILGLYCSNIISIFSAVYTNAPDQVSYLFQRDVITNKSINHIIEYLILDLIMLIEHILKITQSVFSLFTLSGFIIFVIVYYAKTRNRTFQLSNSYSVSQTLYAEISKAIRRVSHRGLFSQDISFQAFYQKIVERQLKTLFKLAQFNNENTQNRNSSMLDFMRSNLIILGSYWESKKSIPYNSRWYKQKITHKQWHWASDNEIEIALRTGTSLRPSEETNYDWFEDEIYKINDICFDKLCETNDYQSIFEYLYAWADLQEKAASAGALHNALQYIFSIQERIQLFYEEAIKAAKGKPEAEKSLLGIIEVIIAAYTGEILGVNKMVREINVSEIINGALNAAHYSRIDFSLTPYLNNSNFEKLSKQIETELKIEKEKITPDWYVRQVIAKIIYDHLCEMIEIDNRIINSILPAFGEFFRKKALYTEAMLVFSKMQEVLSKGNAGVSIIKSLLPILLSMHKEQTIIWGDNPYDNYTKATRSTIMRLPREWMDTSAVFALNHWTRREEYPDLLGFCYYNFCEYLISSIEENDLEKFQSAYSYFIGVMLLYQEYVRNDLLKIKEKYRQRSVFHIWTAPVFEYAFISGVAILWGAINREDLWSAEVNRALQNYMQEKSDTATKVFKQWCSMIANRRHDSLGIGARDILETSWELRISNAVENNDHIEYEFGLYGKTIKTNDPLLHAFLTTGFSGFNFHDADEVFLISCLNKYLAPEDRYKSQSNWESRLNNEETNENR